ncbi:hypothetical protein [Parasphingorhabdus cellanae]|uniref:Lipoprotein n=1 Tax=Parasphingorhabdus cellanae TaxID=2806553 RepID=A0ABX7T5R8_9SPHN|nr:hypothetical protein [Parasphingorhabdus cellanae]QTD56944.1 hypothetical protein J4G78_05075 [Parasphingorhabdus cellanae]
MTKTYLAALAVIPLTLSACSVSDEGANEGQGDDGFEMSIDLDGEAGDKADSIKIGGSDEDTKFSIKTDGFSMDVDLPQISLDSDDIDLNNVALYPGTKVTALNVEDKDGQSGKFILRFDAPTGADNLTSWFEQKMAEKNFTVAKDGNTLSGKTDEGDPFLLELTAAGSDRTTGKLEFSETK